MRINGIEVEGADQFDSTIEPGRYFLALYSHHNYGKRIETGAARCG